MAEAYARSLELPGFSFSSCGIKAQRNLNGPITWPAVRIAQHRGFQRYLKAKWTQATKALLEEADLVVYLDPSVAADATHIAPHTHAETWNVADVTSGNDGVLIRESEQAIQRIVYLVDKLLATLKPKETVARPPHTVTTHDLQGETASVPIDELSFRPAAYGVCIHDGHLLVMRAQGQKWSLPGGAIEIYERPEDTVPREVQEETGLTIETHRLLFWDQAFFFHNVIGQAFNSIAFVFLCTPTDHPGELIPKHLEIDGDELEYAAWLPLTKVQPEMFAGTHAGFIKKLQKKGVLTA